MRKWQLLFNNILKLIYKTAQVHNNILKLKRWTRCRWEWCLPATESINVELQKITQPWRPLLSYNSGAETHDRDMIGESYHRRSTHLWCSDDFFDTTIVYCSQGYVEEEPPDAIKNLRSTYVPRIINKRLLWLWYRSFYSIYMYSRRGYPLLGNLDPPIHPKHT